MKLKGIFFMPSLQHIAFTKIAVVLWNEQYVKYLAQHVAVLNLYDRYILTHEWYIVMDKVVKNADKLPMPNSLKPELSRFVRALGFRILLWFSYHKNLYHEDFSVTFCWTMQGIIDYRKTAEILVRDENLSVFKRYALACLYCFEESISSLNNSVGFQILEDGIANVDTSVKQLILLWSDYIEGIFPFGHHQVAFPNQPSRITFAIHGLKIAEQLNNVVAIKFFCDIFPERNKGINLVGTARRMLNRIYLKGTHVIFADTLGFLLSAMNEDEQMQLLKDYPWKVLNAFLVSPWQECFIVIVEHLRASFTENAYYALLDMIIDKVKDIAEDYDYRKLFTKYWYEISIDYRRYFVTKAIEEHDLMKFLKIGNQQLVHLILEVTSASQKEGLIFSSATKNVCLRLIRLGNWDMLEFFLMECLRSMDEVESKIVQLKQKFEQYKQRFAEEGPGDIWQNFFMLLNKFNNDDISVKESPQT